MFCLLCVLPLACVRVDACACLTLLDQPAAPRSYQTARMFDDCSRTWQLFDDQDVNKDMQLSLEEWNQGGGYLTSADDER